MKQSKTGSKPYLLLYIIAIAAVLVFAFVIIGHEGFQELRVTRDMIAGTVYPTEVPVLTATPLPERFAEMPRDYFENENETTKLITGGAVILGIILLGVLISRRNNEK